MNQKSLCVSLFFTFSLISLSQVPAGFNYQAIARDDAGTPITNTAIPVTLTIQSDSLGGTIYWEELHSSVTTNNYGLITLVVGKGTRQSASQASSFEEIDWKSSPVFIRTQLFYKSHLIDMGVTRMQSVPFAMVAGDLAGAVRKLEVEGKNTGSDEALFEVKNRDGKTVFAVYNEGVRIYVGEGLNTKGVKGGFSVGGYDMSKGSQDYLIVSSDSIRAYIAPTTGKGVKGGFSVGGYDMTKSGNDEFLRVTTDSVKVSKSLLIPRLTTYERDHLPFTPGDALIIFNMTESCMQIYKNSVWSNIWCFNCAPSFIFQPASKTICSGEDAEFFLSATGTSLSYQWQESQDKGNSWYNILDGGVNPRYSGCNFHTLSLKNVSVSHHDFRYRCIVTGSCLPNIISDPATLNVGSSPAIIATQPENRQLSSGCSANFSVFSPGYGVTYKWQESSNGGNTWNNISDGGIYSGSTTSTLSLNGVGFVYNNYKYRCIAGNSCGSNVTSNTATLSIASTSILTQPVSTQLTTDCTASFNITCPSGYVVSFQWQASSNNGSTWNNISDGGSSPAYSGTTTSVLSISNVPKTYINYQYRCIVNSLCGPNETSSAATLSLSSSPIITVQPVDELVYAGQNIIFNLTTTGNGISYQWQLSTNGGAAWSDISDGGSNPVYSGCNTASFKLSKVPLTFDTYKYRCKVSQYCRPDEISNAVTLSVKTTESASDADGNTYNTVGIGSQLWMAENLKTTKYSNGDLIGTTSPATKDITSETSPEYQWAYAGNESNVALYGRLYTWYAVTDSRNVCPAGWHVPTDVEWTILTEYLSDNGYGFGGDPSQIGKSLAATSGWPDCANVGSVGNDQASNNSSGFSAIPGGYRSHSGGFDYGGNLGYWWSVFECPATSSYTRYMDPCGGNLVNYCNYRQNGYPVRCLKNQQK
jgi:uncharacterized protein (TIGR02145 family)